MKQADTRTRLINYFRASFPGIAVNSTEEQRILADILSAAKECDPPKAVVTWSVTEGCQKFTGDRVEKLDNTEDLVQALKLREERTVLVLRDAQTWNFRDPVIARSLRDALQALPPIGGTVVFVGPDFQPHPTFERMVTVIEYELPGPEALRGIAENIKKSAGKKCDISDDVIRALGGLNTSEAENALSLSIIECGKFDAEIIYREKTSAVRKSGLLEIVDPDPRGLGAIGGLDNLKSWITKRRAAYTAEAERFGLPAPRGILLVGVPGTGKSLAAKAVGTALGVPTIRMDIGKLFNSLVGESEARARDALKLAEAMAPCVLWVDEIDKGLSGSSGSGSNDSGVTRRVFGTIISWMQERKRPVFLVATANQVESLPPELLRKGRFDEIFSVDLPNAMERKRIFEIHLDKKGRKPALFDVDALARESDGFTGSEIEEAVVSGLYDAFDKGRELDNSDLTGALRSTVPLSKTAKEQIDAIRRWAETRARPANAAEAKAATNGRKLS